VSGRRPLTCWYIYISINYPRQMRWINGDFIILTPRKQDDGQFLKQY